jgi:hypothetical protein
MRTCAIIHPLHLELETAHQFVVLMRGEANEGHEICEDALAARAFDL